MPGSCAVVKAPGTPCPQGRIGEIHALLRKTAAHFETDSDSEEFISAIYDEPACPLWALANQAAAAAVLEEALPPAATTAFASLLPGLSSCSVAIIDGSTAALVHRPVFCSAEMPVSVAATAAAWAAMAAPRALADRHDGSKPGTGCNKWQEVACGEHGGHAIATLPLRAPGAARPLGAATYAFSFCPVAQGGPEEALGVLERFSRLLARAIAALGASPPHLSAELLGAAVPRALVLSMVGARATAATPCPAAATAPQAACGKAPASQRTHRQHPAPTPAPPPPPEPPAAAESAGRPRAASSRSPSSSVVLGFEGLRGEGAFRRWFTARQCSHDAHVAASHTLTVAMVMSAAVARGMPSMALVLALQSGTGCLLPAAMAALGRNRYRRHRTVLVSACRLVGTAALLAHWLAWPRLFAGSAARGLVGRAVGRLALGAVHSKVRWRAHAAVTAGELFLCAAADVVAFAAGCGAAPDGGLGLRATLAAQAAAALVATAGTFVAELCARVAFAAWRAGR